MRAVVQRVSQAAVNVDGEVHSAIGPGLLVYAAIGQDDQQQDLAYIADKVRHLRIFKDDADKLNLDVVQAGGHVLAVSAFTVYADARKGRRPSFDAAAEPDRARDLFDQFCRQLTQAGLDVRQGVFQARMAVESINDGPICILLDSGRGF